LLHPFFIFIGSKIYWYAMIVLPTSYFPNIRYFAVLAQAAQVQVEIWETYPKQTPRNHCIIMGSNGPLKLSVPVKKAYGTKTKTADVLTDTRGNWPLIHWRAIEAAYNSSPYFLYYREEIGPLFKTFGQKKISELNLEITKKLCDICGIGPEFSFTQTYIKLFENTIIDFREIFSTQNNNPSDYPFYLQVFSNKFNFVPNLSILDLICNLGPETKNYLRKIRIY